MTLLKFGSCYERIMQCETNQYVRTGLLKHLKTPPSSGGLEFSGKKKKLVQCKSKLGNIAEHLFQFKLVSDDVGFSGVRFGKC